MTTLDQADRAQTHDAISERAAEYFEQRRCGEWVAADQAELDVWLAESFLHRAAYLRVAGAFARAEHLVALYPREFEGGRQPGIVGKFMHRRFMIPLLAAASIALMAMFAVPYVISLLQPADRNFSTDVGGRTLLKFADGTEIELNTDTAMRFRMTTAERTVWLDRGEAWFHVSHDAAHPFTVVIGRHRVTDLGTEFFVRRDPGDVEVALMNGRAMLNTEGTPTAMLAPGDDAVATPISVSVIRKAPQELADELAWRQGMLVFRNARLSDVVREFNRYNTTKLVITDPFISDKRISVHARTNDYEDFLQLAKVVLKLNIDREGSVILISRGSRNQVKRTAHTNHNL
jgi:transmembrane sensor